MEHSRDRIILYGAAFLRATATGMVAVLLGIHLARLGFDPAAIGGVVAAGLSGAAAAALLTTLAGDRAGRRLVLTVLALAAALGTGIVAFASDPALIGFAAFFGMLNGMGRDRGASMILDQVVLPATTTDRRRTAAFAKYNIAQDAGHALGSLLAGLPMLLRSVFPIGETESLRFGILATAGMLLLTAILYRGLSPAVEAEDGRRKRELSPSSRRVVTRISALFALDGVGGGFLTTALLSFFFYARFGVGEGVIGALFFGARVMNAFSHLGAAWLARRIGLVNTMVFTHIPSSLLLVTVTIAPSFAVAAALFLLREGLVEMDVPTRQSYVMAVVAPEERTVASGITHLVRLGAWAVAPAFAGFLMRGGSIAAPLWVGAGMKIGYDVLLYRAFRSVRPPEERAEPVLTATKQ
ncbi:MAG TPA: MFS transporter [Candidatus Eisenbacteria bacterium]|nr:MFS transporter [Candidatus Eisenbacteria bacterium]